MRKELELGTVHGTNLGMVGIVRYVGPAFGSLARKTSKNQGFVLLELDTPSGNCDGTVGAVSIIRLAELHGLWVQREHVYNAVMLPPGMQEEAKGGDAPAGGAVAAAAAARALGPAAGAPAAAAAATRVQGAVRAKQARSKVVRQRVRNRKAEERGFAKVDRYAVRAPKGARASFESLVAYLVKPWPLGEGEGGGEEKGEGPDNEEKRARCIFRWVAENVTYDMSRYVKGQTTASSQSPEAVLKTGLAVCSGFAGLLKALLDVAGIECQVISGCSKAASYKPGTPASALKCNHAWSAIKIGGAWQLCDCTWASGHSTGDHKYVDMESGLHMWMSRRRVYHGTYKY